MQQHCAVYIKLRQTFPIVERLAEFLRYLSFYTYKDMGAGKKIKLPHIAGIRSYAAASFQCVDYSWEIAPVGHVPAQVPQSTQVFASITY